jgi:tetratricopeptide (TPR) repeat protein
MNFAIVRVYNVKASGFVVMDVTNELSDSKELVARRASLAEAIWDAIMRTDCQAAISLWSTAPTSSRDASSSIATALALRKLLRFDEADVLLIEAISQYPDNLQLRMDRGWLEIEREDWVTALQRWREARRLGLEHEALDIGESIVLRKMGRYADAESVLRTALIRFPNRIGIARDLSLTVAERGEWHRAKELLRQLVTVDPSDEQHRREFIFALTALRDYDYAEALYQIAKIAEYKADWKAAETRWQAAQLANPEDVIPLVGLGSALIRQRRYEAAELLLTANLTRFPDSKDLAMQWANCAADAGRRQEALARWCRLRAQWETDVWVSRGLGQAMIDIGQFQEARELIGESLLNHPNHRELLYLQATLASRVENWKDAQRLWQSLVHAYPEDLSMREGLMAAHFGARQTSLDNDESRDTQSSPIDSGVANVTPRASTEGRTAELVLAFESLGCDCEFGLVQRYYECEPLGLLRWAGTSPDAMIAAAKSQFEGVGEPENIVIEVWPNGEYCVSDQRFEMLTHSFTYETTVSKEIFTKQQVRRGRYLRQKLIADIRAGEKIFIYKSAEITESQAFELFSTLKEIGPICLFVVFLANAINLPLTAKEVEKGLIFGYMPSFHNLQAALPPDIARSWAILCRQALVVAEVSQSTRPGREPSKSANELKS